MKSVHRSYDELLGFQKGNLMDIQHFILLDFEKFSCACISYIYILYQSCKYLFLHNSEIIIGDCIELGVYFYYRIAIKKFQV